MTITATGKATRLRKARGRWMRLTRPDLMRKYMEAHDFTQARMGRYAGCSRQFIWQLLNNEVTTCTPEIGRRIEEALSLLPGTLFVPSVSSADGRPVTPRKTRRAA